MKAHLRKIRGSSKKASIVAGLVRNRPVNEALAMLQFVPNKMAAPLRKCVASAVANAEENEGKNRDGLYVEQVVVNKGTSYRRFKPGPRGRAIRLRKPVAHISVILGEMADKPVKAVKKSEKGEKAVKKTKKVAPKAEDFAETTPAKKAAPKAKKEVKTEEKSKTKKD